MLSWYRIVVGIVLKQHFEYLVCAGSSDITSLAYCLIMQTVRHLRCLPRRKCTFTDCKKDYSNKCSYLQTTRIVCHIYLVPFSLYWIRGEARLFTRLFPLYHYYFRRDFVLLTFDISIQRSKHCNCVQFCCCTC